ncbi:MAG TPA: phosphoketolase family protein [Myxococcales bacterium]|nr:phosphoketolase family protein [Myxococcales bacterium]
MPHTLAAEELALLDAWWRAANYLTVGQIYLKANPLLREPLRPEHIKPRLLGHWGTSPGLSLLYAHMNRLIRKRNVDAIFMAGPGHGGPALIANVWLEGTWTEIYPEVGLDLEGMRRLFRQFSTPYGVPSHVSPPVPGSIHEGGELGYVLTHAFGAAFDNRDLLVLAVVGDGEAETGPLEGSWKGVSFLDPARDGAVLPVLHLNGYKIANPTVLGRKPDEEIASLFRGHGYEPYFVVGDEPARVHAALAETLDACYDRIREIQHRAGREGAHKRRWPMIVLRTPKGWTGPKQVDGVQVEGTFRAHQVPLPGVRENPEHLAALESWMKSYRPEELFDASGAPKAELRALAPEGLRRMSANPHANGGRLLVPLDLPDYTQYAIEVKSPATVRHESTRQLGMMLRDLLARNARQQNFRLFCPDELTSNRLGAVLEVTNRAWMEQRVAGDDHLAPDGRVMEVLSEHNCEGWLEGYLLTGRHGLFCTYEAFAMVVASMATQHAKWLEMCRDLPWRAPVASLNVLLTSTCWRNDHNGFSHQGPGFIDTIVSKQGTVARVYLPPDANCLLSVADHCLRSRSYVNLIVIDKQPQLQWLDMDHARAHCTRGAGVWDWASSSRDEPDVILACAGDVPTLETVAAAWWLRRRAPHLAVRVVNVVDLFSIADPLEHPHGMPGDQFVQIFTRDTDVVFAFHGYPGLLHGILHGRPNAGRFHVRGYREEGTTTTPFDMVVLNGMSRFHLCIEALRRARRRPENADELIDDCELSLRKHTAWVKQHLEDMPAIRDWTWTP